MGDCRRDCTGVHDSAAAALCAGVSDAASDTMYTGLLVNVEDANYITIIQRGSEGAWTHSLRFTSEPDAPAYLYVFYLGVGTLGASRWDGCDDDVACVPAG